VSAVFQGAPHAIVSLDGRGLIHDWNPAAATTFGWSAAEAVGQPFWDIAVSPEHRRIRAQISPARTTRAEIVARRRDGVEFPAIISLSAIVGAELSMCCAIVEDVTEARRLEMELAHAQKLEAVGRLAAGLAHEINTPCQFIGTNTEFLTQAFTDIDQLLSAYEVLRNRAGAEPALAEAAAEVVEAEDAADVSFLRERAPRALRDIMDGVRRVSGIVAAMKDFAQPDVREGTSIDVNRALESTLTVVASETRPVADVVTDFGDLPPVVGYAGELNQAFLQVVLNGAQAIADQHARTGQRGRITIRTRADADGVRIDIADTGGGIPEAIRPRIFEPFFTTKEVGRGTGQGLPVARGVIVDRHRGTLTFASEVGAGTTFHILLPLRPPS
jgi:PAS domain S-box-containing protein